MPNNEAEIAKVNALREFAIKRSCNAAAAANDNSRPMAQSALLINGAAASAIIAFLTKDKIDPVLFKAVPWALASYALGVVCASIAMYFMTESLDYWNVFWEKIARDEPQQKIDEQEELADSSWRPVRWFYFLSIAFFFAGSATLACALVTIPVPMVSK